MAEARITEFFGETQTDGRSVRIREEVLDFMGLVSCMPREAWGLPSSQPATQSTALTGASLRSCHETKRFRILATLQRGNKSMYSNTSGYVHMGLRLDWGKGITGQ